MKAGFKDLWDRGPEVFEATTWYDLPWLVGVLFALPALILGIVAITMFTGGRPYAALGVLGGMLALEGAVLALIMLTIPSEVFKPSLYGVLLVVPALVGLTAAGILLIAERYTWVIVILATLAVWMVGVVLVQFLAEPLWPNLRVDFTWVLVTIGLLLSLEWFTRKMLRLA